MISAARTPESVLFTRTTDIRSFPGRGFPSGLEVCAALGSDLARLRIGAEEHWGPQVLETIVGGPSFLDGESIYEEYLACVAALVDPPDSGAPGILAGDAWKRKSCQTVLAGWAQLRHTWALQAKRSVTYMGESLSESKPDVVEPDPEFFARFGRLATRTRDALAVLGALAPDTREIAREIRACIEWWQAKDPRGEPRLPPFQSPADTELAELLDQFRSVLGEESAGDAQLLRGKLLALAEALEAGTIPTNDRLARLIEGRSGDLAPLWKDLIALCQELERFARRQLAAEPIPDSERMNLGSYGMRLGRIMLYGGNSWLGPRDDAPRIMDVHYDPNQPDRPYLEAGIDRPRAIYVLYPGAEGEYLTRGVVLPYHEFRSPMRLTDAEWRALLDGGNPPRQPDWTHPILTAALRQPARSSN